MNELVKEIMELTNEAYKYKKECERKDNIINELKEQLKEARKELQPGELIIGQGLIDNILDKIKELETDRSDE